MDWRTRSSQKGRPLKIETSTTTKHEARLTGLELIQILQRSGHDIPSAATVVVQGDYGDDIIITNDNTIQLLWETHE